MKFRTFKEKLPVLGSNIITMSDNIICITEFTLELRRLVLDHLRTGAISQDPYLCMHYTDDASEDNEYEVVGADYWCYPSDLLEHIPPA